MDRQRRQRRTAAVYAHGAGTDEPLLRLTGASGSPAASSQAYVADGLGSIVAALRNITAGASVTPTSVTPTNSFSEGSSAATGMPLPA